MAKTWVVPKPAAVADLSNIRLALQKCGRSSEPGCVPETRLADTCGRGSGAAVNVLSVTLQEGPQRRLNAKTHRPTAAPLRPPLLLYTMTAEPLRSTISLGTTEDTSLALPSDSSLRSGQRRVLDQVTTVRRSRSKTLKSGSQSPTSPPSDAVFTEFRSFKFSPTKTSADFFSRTNSSGMTIKSTQTKQEQIRSFSMKDPTRLQRSSTSRLPDRMKPSSSDSALTKNRSATLPAHTQSASKYSHINGFSQPLGSHSGQVVNRGQLIQTVSNQSNTDLRPKMNKGKMEIDGTSWNENLSDFTIKEAVEYLSRPEENFQLCGASIIQYNTFKDEKTKEEVFQLNGIPSLVSLLGSPNPQLQQTAAAALRNLVFKNKKNKMEVQRCGGIREALKLIRDTNSIETQRQLTGLLWNLSSANNLKPELIQNALPVLTESVVVPFLRWSDTSGNNNVDSEVFYNTTGCLRNLSSTDGGERQTMRMCPGLIESLVGYVQNCVETNNPDDKSVENCACILHNLTYQLETESPSSFSSLSSPFSRSTASKKSPNFGCFSPQSSKVEEQNYFDFPLTEDSDPKGLSFLYHSKTMQTYLSLLGSSQKDCTLEACAGALQNLTANKGIVSTALGQVIVQKLNGLQHITPLLQTPNSGLQRTVVSLLGNLSRNQVLKNSIAQQSLPQLANILSAGAVDRDNSDDTLAAACRTFHSLVMAEPELGKKVLSDSVLNSLSDISCNGYLPKARKAASLLLYGLWSEKDFQSFLKKQGKQKSFFVNEATSAAYRSMQVIE
ncbi:plakophilin-1-like [Arapaima gigas]